MPKYKMKPTPINLRCAVCDAEQGDYATFKEVPKVFTCLACHTPQRSVVTANVGFSTGRNYPEGHYDGD